MTHILRQISGVDTPTHSLSVAIRKVVHIIAHKMRIIPEVRAKIFPRFFRVVSL